MLATLFGAPVDFVGWVIRVVELLRNQAPVVFSIFPALTIQILYDSIQKDGFPVWPVVIRQIGLFVAEPFGHAAFTLDPGDKVGDEVPVVGVLYNGGCTRSLSI